MSVRLVFALFLFALLLQLPCLILWVLFVTESVSIKFDYKLGSPYKGFGLLAPDLRLQF